MTVDKLCASYLYKRDGTYYFSKHVPCDVAPIMKKLEKLGAITLIQAGKRGRSSSRAAIYRREI